MRQSIQNNKGLSEGFILASLPFLAYLYTFAYEAGYASFFKIPLHFISLNMTSVFIVGGTLFVSLASLYWFFWLISHLFIFLPKGEIPNPVHRAMWKAIFMSVLWLLIILVILAVAEVKLDVELMWKIVLIVVLILAIYLFFEMVLPVIFHPEKKTYREKFAASHMIEEDQRYETLSEFLSRETGGNFSLILLLLFLAVIPHIAGRSAASRQQEFLTFDSKPPGVVLRIYGENMICSALQKKTKKLEVEFFVKKISSDSKLILRLEKVGPLQGKKIENKKPGTVLAGTVSK